MHMVEKVRTEPSAAHSTLRERVPAGTGHGAGRCPLIMAATPTAVWALWTTAEHVGSMARPTTADNITLYDDVVFCDTSERVAVDVCVDPAPAGLVCSCILECSAGTLGQRVCLSVPVKHPSGSDHSTATGPQSELLVRVAHAEHDSAPMC